MIAFCPFFSLKRLEKPEEALPHILSACQLSRATSSPETPGGEQSMLEFLNEMMLGDTLAMMGENQRALEAYKYKWRISNIQFSVLFT